MRKPPETDRPRTHGGPWRLFRLRLTLLVWGIIAALGLLLWAGWDLPDPGNSVAAMTRRPAVTVLDADDRVIARTGDIHGAPVRLTEVPAYLPDAFLAVEDKRFYSHYGVDPLALARAAWVNLKAGGVREGGSTLTQQLAKNLFLTPERSLRRKAQEALLALWLEWRLGKDAILEIYLNRIYLGAGVYGVDAAARRYFGKPARLLTLGEAAMLAGLPKAPSRDNPLAAPERAAARMQLVLERMTAQGRAAPAQAAAARRNPPRVTTRPIGQSDRYLADWAMERARDLTGPAAGDLVIRTTLNPRHQAAAEAAAAALRAEARKGKAGQMALASLAADGAVTAMLGGWNWLESPFNRAVLARRQPGSAFKVAVFLAGLESGLTPDSLIDPRGISISGWAPRDGARTTPSGPLTLREAAARSLNTAAVAVSEHAGRERVMAAARRLGISTPLAPDPALPLGVHDVTLLELTAAYAVFANRGQAVIPYVIRDIRDGAGRLLYRREAAGDIPVASQPTAAAMDDLLTAAVSQGTGRAARLTGYRAAGKTGTTQDNRDAWFIGYAGGLTAGIWMGNDDAAPMQGVSGGGLPARLWRGFMQSALSRLP